MVTDHNVEMALRLHYLEKESYVNRLIDYIKGLVSDN